VFGTFELIHTFYRLNLSANELFHFFIPLLAFGFDIPLALAVIFEFDPFGLAVSVSAFISSLIGWLIYCTSKAKGEQYLFSSTSHTLKKPN